jgi:hypothetical protein
LTDIEKKEMNRLRKGKYPAIREDLFNDIQLPTKPPSILHGKRKSYNVSLIPYNEEEEVPEVMRKFRKTPENKLCCYFIVSALG